MQDIKTAITDWYCNKKNCQPTDLNYTDLTIIGILVEWESKRKSILAGDVINTATGPVKSRTTATASAQFVISKEQLAYVDRLNELAYQFASDFEEDDWRTINDELTAFKYTLEDLDQYAITQPYYIITRAEMAIIRRLKDFAIAVCPECDELNQILNKL